MAKRECLNGSKIIDLMKKLTGYFESQVNVLRIRFGEIQTIETLINEEALLLAKFLRNERLGHRELLRSGLGYR